MKNRLKVTGTAIASLCILVLLIVGLRNDLRSAFTQSTAQNHQYAAATKPPWNLRQVALPAILTKEPANRAVYGLRAIRLQTPAPAGYPAGATQIGLLWTDHSSIWLQPWQGAPQVLVRSAPQGDHSLSIAAAAGSQGAIVLLDDQLYNGAKQRLYWWNLSTGQHQALVAKAPWHRAFHTSSAWIVTGGTDAAVYSLGILPSPVRSLPSDLLGAAVWSNHVFGSWRGRVGTYDWQTKTFLPSAVQVVHHASLSQAPDVVTLLGSWGPTFVFFPHSHAAWPASSLVLISANGRHRYVEPLKSQGTGGYSIAAGSDYIVKSKMATAQFWIGWVTAQGRFLWHYGGHFSSGPHRLLSGPVALAHRVVWVDGPYTYVWRAPRQA